VRPALRLCVGDGRVLTLAGAERRRKGLLGHPLEYGNKAPNGEWTWRHSAACALRLASELRVGGSMSGSERHWVLGLSMWLNCLLKILKYNRLAYST
jgi:hypothetical protein